MEGSRDLQNPLPAYHIRVALFYSGQGSVRTNNYWMPTER